MKVLIAAGGTGGHINPGIAIANKVKQEDPTSEVLFVGTKKGIEQDLVPKAGYKLQLIRSAGITKKINIDNLKNIYKLFLGIQDSKRIIKNFKPDVVIGTGGYVSAPVLYRANKMKIPTILHESNALPGKTVKLLSKKADKVLVGFEEAKKRLPHAKQVVLTGSPTKMSNINLSSQEINEIRENMGLKPDKTTVLVFGGSQGAKTINDAMLEIITSDKKRDYQIIFAPGPKQYEKIKASLEEKGMKIVGIDGVKILPYIYNMEKIMNAVDLLVCRSGAMTITEIATVGVASILVPFPFAAENHQEYNAKALENVGAAKIILDKEMTGDILSKEIENMIKDKDKLKQMGQNAKKIAISDSEEKIYNEIKKSCM